MMQVMGHAHGPEIRYLGASEPFNSLMNEDIMYQKISQTIECYSNSGRETPVHITAAKYD
jgi:hypothetical protein